MECTGVKLICPDYYKSISTEELIWLVTKKLSLLKTFDNLIKGFKIILTDKKEYFIKIHEDHENYADLTYALDIIQSLFMILNPFIVATCWWRMLETKCVDENFKILVTVLVIFTNKCTFHIGHSQVQVPNSSQNAVSVKELNWRK